MPEQLNSLIDDEQEDVVDLQDPEDGAGEDNPEEILEDQEEEEPGDDGEPAPQPPEENHKFAEFRKKQEAETRRIAEEKAKSDQLLNTLFESAYKGETNPFTGKPIETVDDFLAWKEENERQALQQAGLSPDYIKQMIDSNPAIQQANAIIKMNQEMQGRLAVDREIAEIQKVNPKIKTFEDLVADNANNEIFNALVNGGMSLSKAYATVHKIPQKKTDDSKAHLQSVGGGGTGSVTEKEIPANLLEMWQETFPDDKPAELRARYNRAIKEQGE